MKKVRWGILGAANIARKNWLAIRDTGNSTVAAVASRKLERARQFIAECQREAPMESPAAALDNYESILRNPEVDAVYIPLPTGARKEWVIRAAQAGKHVLCEKPCATSIGDLEGMTEACNRASVQFMDGVMFTHSFRLEALREVLDHEIGEVRRITSCFSFLGSEEFFARDIRMNRSLEPFGCLGDLGWYCIRLALWAMKGTMPERVTGRVLRSAANDPQGVPVEFSGELFFPNGVSSSFYCSFVTEISQWAHIDGSKGLIHLDDFVLPFSGNEIDFEVSQPAFIKRGCDFKMEARNRTMRVPVSSHSHPSSQEASLFRDFANLVLSGKPDPYWPEIALKTQRVMEACTRSSRRESRETAL